MYIYFPKLPYLCTANSKSSFGGLAHLARARHWQCRGDRFESGNLHLIQKKVVFNKDNLFFYGIFPPLFEVVQKYNSGFECRFFTILYFERGKNFSFCCSSQINKRLEGSPTAYFAIDCNCLHEF